MTAESTDQSDDRVIRVPTGSGWPEGDALVAELMQRCASSDAILAVEELIERVRMMGIAERFLRDKPVYSSLYGPAETSHHAVTMPRAGNVNEAGSKRRQLLHHLAIVRSELISAFGSLGIVLLDIEATNRNDDGTVAEARPPEDDLLPKGSPWHLETGAPTASPADSPK